MTTLPICNIKYSNRNLLIKQISASMMISVTDEKGIIIYANEHFCNEFQYTRSEILGNTHSLIKHEDNLEEIYFEIWHKISNKQNFYGKIKNRSKNGDELYHFIFIVPILDEVSSEVLEYVCIRDKIGRDDYFDYTDFGLYGNTTIEKNKHLLTNYLRAKCKYNCALIDINNFSDINNYYGYAQGDKILKQISTRLISVFTIFNIFKYSGDVYCILLRNKNNKAFLNLILQKVALIFKEPFQIEETEVYLDYSIGISAGNKKNVIIRANTALKNSKNKNQIFSVYSSSIHLDNKKLYKENTKMIKEIKDALKEDRIVPFFQPIHDNNKNLVTKYECLARIKKRDKNEFISPGVFIPVAEKSKLINEITKVMIEKSFKYFNKYENMELSINLTVGILLNKDMTKFITKEVGKFNNPERIIFEVVESEQYPSELFNKNEFILKMKSKGCKFAMDDFGSGYSNLAVFANFGYDYVKLDGSLITLIHTEKGYSVIETIVNVAKKCNVKIVAEWVTDEETLRKVKKLGIEYSQGFYFGKPIEEILCM